MAFQFIDQGHEFVFLDYRRRNPFCCALFFAGMARSSIVPAIEGWRSGPCPRSMLGGQFPDQGGHEVVGNGAGGDELAFQFVDQGHEFVHLGDDAALFSEGWEGN